MAKARPGIPLSIVILALLACASTPERLLDQTCTEQRCQTTGSAHETSGLTGDSLGFEIGPGPGSVAIPVHHNVLTDGPLELLLKGSGSLVVTIGPEGCTNCSSQSIELNQGWTWESAGPISGFGLDGANFTLVVETLDDTSHAQLLDFRIR